ncbi:MAG: NAD-binding protein [Planctomycetota bacterium]|nr:MAG: NAD-binding protein [Planctomycetota bacterium]
MIANSEAIEQARHGPWDVIVLGAGPAGAVAARRLALAGRGVLLVEKSRWPREKACGGCLGAAALGVLDEVGLARLPAECGGVRLSAMELACRGSKAVFPIDRRVAVARQRFDAALVSAATDAGAVFIDQALGRVLTPAQRAYRAVQIHRGGDAWVARARAVIVATGLGGRETGAAIRSGSRIGLGAIVPHASPAGERIQMALGRAGYAGVAPLGGGLLDVAAAVDRRALAAAGSPAALVGSIFAEAGVALPPGLDDAQWRGTPPLTQHAVQLASHRTLLVGDAAGYVEPFTGEGIGWAMHTALVASAIVDANLQRWSTACERLYELQYRHALGRRQRCCYGITRLLRHRLVRTATVGALRRLPALARPLVSQLERPLARSRQ